MVILSKNLESLACTFILLHLSYTLIFIVLLCLPCKNWRSFVSLLFFHSPLADLLFFFFFIVSQLHACVVCIALPTDLAVVPTRDFYFVFVVFRK